MTIIMFSSIYAREMQAFGLAARNDVRLPHPYDSKFAAHIAVLNFSHRNLAGFRLFDGSWTMQSYLRWLECPVLQLQIKPYLRFLSSMQDLSIARTLSRSAIERKKTKSSQIWARIEIPHESNRNDVPIPPAHFHTTKKRHTFYEPFSAIWLSKIRSLAEHLDFAGHDAQNTYLAQRR